MYFVIVDLLRTICMVHHDIPELNHGPAMYISYLYDEPRTLCIHWYAVLFIRYKVPPELTDYAAIDVQGPQRIKTW